MSPSSADFAPFWEEVEDCFDPEEPVHDPRLFAERERKYSAVATIMRRLRPGARKRSKYLLTGTKGNGKSSELNHCVAELVNTRFVVQLDVHQHLASTVRAAAAIDQLDPWELVGLIGMAVFRGAESLGHEWSKPEKKALEKALGDLQGDSESGQPQIDLAKLVRGLAVTAGGAAAAALGGLSAIPLGAKVGARLVTTTAEAAQWNYPLGRRKGARLDDQDAAVQNLVNAVNRLIMTLQELCKRPLLFVLDGLDRIENPERLRALFVSSTLLSQLVCDAIVTAPQLPFREASQGLRGFEHCDLRNIPVVDREHPDRAGSGVHFFRDLVRLRLTVLRASARVKGIECPADPLPEAIVDRLAYLSGGIPRDFVRLVRLSAIEAFEGGAATLTEELIAPAVRSERDRKEFLINSDEIKVLRKVMNDPARRLPGGELAFSLVEQKRLIPYPNDSTWYYPHPLLTLGVLRPGSP